MAIVVILAVVVGALLVAGVVLLGIHLFDSRMHPPVGGGGAKSNLKHLPPDQAP